MRKNCGIIVGMSNEAIKRVIDSVSLRAYAEEGVGNNNNTTTSVNNGGSTGDTDSTSSTSSVINYEDLISKARKEEKEKQYNTIEKLKTQNNTLTEQHNSDLIRIAELEKEINSVKEKSSGVSVEDLNKANETIKSLEKQLQDVYDDTVNREEVEKEIRERLEEEYEVKTYKTTKLLELKNDLLVPELVVGTTKEEIDNSIQLALERSAEIKKSLGISSDNKSTSKRTPKSPANPSVSSVQDTEISLEKLATMDVKSPEYAELRKQLGLR